jgi:acyl-CoA reductase-like NAD-dependent aldehyde dehydrogenase
MQIEKETESDDKRVFIKSEKTTPFPDFIDVVNPANGMSRGKVPSLHTAEAYDVLCRVHKAQKKWADRSIKERSDVISRFAEILYNRVDEVAEIISAETGKPLYESMLCEALPIIHLAGYYARNAESQLKNKRIKISYFKNRSSYIHYKPRGVVFIISPWNFPFTIPCGAVICALLAGNGVLLKPASLTPLTAYKIRELLVEAGVDEQAFEVISGPGSMASNLIDTSADLIDFVNFTGSTEVGKKVAQLCGKHLLPCSMELGGKDPAIVCSDANLNLAAKSITFGAFCNSGQICASVERVYVHSDVYDSFVDKLKQNVLSLRQGDPQTEGFSIDMGCMTSTEQLLIVERQVADARAKGAKIITGGKRMKPGGMYFEPTLILDADDTMEVVYDESFGPLLPVMRVDSDEEAIARSNASTYGLSAYVFSKDGKKARRIAVQLEAGTVMINDTIITHALPETPWQGVKESGIGRVHSEDALRDFSIAYHVNYDTFPLLKPLWTIWTWPPYSAFKVKLFKLLFGFMGLNLGFINKLKILLR